MLDGNLPLLDERYLVCLGLSLTLIMSTALFALIGINPKSESYEMLPWSYAAISAVSAFGFGMFAKRFRRQLESKGGQQPLGVPVRKNENG